MLLRFIVDYLVFLLTSCCYGSLFSFPDHLLERRYPASILHCYLFQDEHGLA